ncbi:MAG: metallophosphoesterase [Bacteroidetes bacterium]|nr:metallophosphoesterase [Bacteroidota bacterium]
MMRHGASGNAELGYGDADETTTISYGADANNKYVTTYFRKSISVNETYDNFTLNLIRDDGAVVYVNGTEVYRSNMAAGAVLYNTLATTAADDGNTQQTVILPASYFINGNNLIAVELHQSAVTSTDISFDLQLIGNRSLASALISWNSIWKYLDNGTNQTTAWIPGAFNDAAWAKGKGELGYGDGDEGTVISYGADSTNKYVTSYFRKTFNNPGGFSSYTLSLKRDDGAVVYVNGTEVFRNNISASPAYTTLATAAASDDGATPQVIMLASSIFATGENTIAIEVHQSAVNSSDLSMDAELTGNIGTLVSLVDFGEKWRYLDNGTNQATAWRATAFADGTWVQGNAELGYGDGDENTTVSYGANAATKYITTYFRKTINIADVSSFKGYSLRMYRDDGLVVYVNGTEVWRNNIPYGTVAYTTLATESAADDGNNMISFNLNYSAFTAGDNCIAVELHQNAASSSDISFDFQLAANTNYDITRGPYLQMGSHQSVMVRFRSNSSVVAKILYGTTMGVYTDSVTEGSATTEHAISVSSLSANTKYFYAVKSGSTILQSGTQNYFITAPTPGTEKEINILATGDCGTGYLAQKDVRDRYMNYLGNKHTDVWMLVGDNAYDAGQEAEYQTGFFDSYEDTLLKNVLLYPAPGNHDYANSASRQNDHNIPYYTIFNTPTAGELGGVSSGTEAYYSYNYGNIHFISLDSYGKESSTTRLYDTLSPQVVWLKNDLNANTQPWVIVYFHHPPYTMGSHNSDTEAELIAMRQNLLTILERYKVDLLICGHSHSYERSYLLKGHYGLETSFNLGTHALSNSSAKYDGSANSCPYIKNAPNNNFGTVYVVTGAAGKFGGTQAAFPHNAMYYSTASYAGATAITINGNRLDAKFVTADGTVRDQFTMMKEVNKNISVNNNLVDTATLSSSWKGTYNWSPVSATTLSVSVSPSSNTTYYVSDNENCLRDTINLNVIIPTISTATVSSPLCAGNALTISFTVTGKFLSANIFTAQLSDAAGSFSSPVNIGSVNSIASGNISCTIPSGTNGGNAYRIRVVSNNPTIFGANNGSNLVVQPLDIWYKDADGDLYSDGNTVTQCTAPSNYYSAGSLTALSGDCNDGSATVYPGTTEICFNGIDDNCNGLIDEACISISGTASNTICTGTSFGAVNITVSGNTPYSFLWSNASTTEDISNLPAGGYTVTVTDVYNSTASALFTVGTTSPTLKPATPGTITGSVAVCADLTTYNYSIAPVANASYYAWAIPTNCNLLSGQGSTAISLQFTSAYSTGALKVTAANCIGTSAAKSVTIIKQAKPASPGTISGTSAVCAGNMYGYSIVAVATATTYTWAAPANSTIVSGQGTTNVSVSFQAGYVTSNLSVTAGNCGGTSAVKTLSVAVAVTPAPPGTITGAVAVCPGTYTIFSSGCNNC